MHRDVKPSNLMVSIDGMVKITDFGVAEELNRYEHCDTTSKSRGSPAFQPPEVAAGSQNFSGFRCKRRWERHLVDVGGCRRVC